MSSRPTLRTTPTPEEIAAATAPVSAPAPAPQPPEPSPEAKAELVERRRFARPIPTPQVIECDEEQAWELWSQWSNL